MVWKQRAAIAGLSVLLGGALATRDVAAEPGLADEVESPIVVAGATEMTLSAGELTDGGDWQARGEASYAYLSWWRSGVAATWQRENGDARLSGIAFENVFDFIPSRRWPVHLGAYAEYERNMAEGPDHIELKLLMQHVQGPFDLRFNIVTERETGDHSGNRWEFGYASQASYRVTPTVRLGVEGFGDTGFDDQLGDIDDYAHYWGPFARLRLASVRDQQLSLQMGYLAGSGHAGENGQLRLQLEWSFNEDDGD